MEHNELGAGGGQQRFAVSKIHFIARTTFQQREPADPAAGTRGSSCLASVLSLIGLLQFHLPG